MSRLDALRKNDSFVNPTSTTGKKAIVRPGGMSRDLSMPRMRLPNSKPTDDLISISKVQQQIGERSGPLYELNVRLQNLCNLHGPSFLTRQYKSLRLLDIRNNRISELPGELCSLT